jgi:hypothetical protein
MLFEFVPLHQVFTCKRETGCSKARRGLASGRQSSQNERKYIRLGSLKQKCLPLVLSDVAYLLGSCQQIYEVIWSFVHKHVYMFIE